MAWITNDQTYTDVIAEIEKQRDRGAALVAAALLEEHLLLAIKSALTRHESVERKMFQGYGPLASFSAKIDLGLLLGLYPMGAHKGFHQIRKIRNEFAHNMKPITFRSQRVKDLCAPLKFARGAYRRQLAIFEHVEPGEFKQLMTETAKIFRSSTVPRRQFMKGVQFLLFLLILAKFVRDPAGNDAAASQ